MSSSTLHVLIIVFFSFDFCIYKISKSKQSLSTFFLLFLSLLFLYKSLQSIWMRDGHGISDKHLDSFCSYANSSLSGGFESILTGHAHLNPPLTRVFDVNGKVVSPSSSSFIRLCEDPQVVAQESSSNCFGSLCGSVSDPNLHLVQCTDEFGEYAKLVLDRMPKRGAHSFVGFVQLETGYNRQKLEQNAYHIACAQANFVRGGPVHYHDGFSCYFGQHNAYCSYVDEYAKRSTTSLDEQVSFCFFCCSFLSLLY